MTTDRNHPYVYGNDRRQENHFLDGRRKQDHPAEPEASTQEHLPQLLLRSQDRHRGSQRRGQVHADEDHSRHRPAVPGQRGVEPGLQRGIPGAGAAARRPQDRDGSGEGGRAARGGRFGRVRGDKPEVRTARVLREREQDERPLRQTGRTAGHHRQHGRMEPGEPSGTRYGRAALPSR